MNRYILTGTPGCGKTTTINALEMKGYCVVREAATDVISYKQTQGDEEPWKKEKFIDDIIFLQQHRQLGMSELYGKTHFYDRSPICTYALSVYLEFKPSVTLMREIDRISKSNVYDREVFFLENLGSIENTDARQISYDEALKFEAIHKEAYKQHGFELINIAPVSVQKRVEFIVQASNSKLVEEK